MPRCLFQNYLRKKSENAHSITVSIAEKYPAVCIYIISSQKEKAGQIQRDNAAPLCPSCHGDFGGNPEKRSRIREMRDRWYDICEKCVIGSRRYPMQSSLEFNRYSFACDEFVHPLIVRELLGWISDSSETVVGVDLESANSSNRFHGDFEIDDRDGRKWVKWKGPESDRREFFKYAHIATSPTGVEMVECYDCGGR